MRYESDGSWSEGNDEPLPGKMAEEHMQDNMQGMAEMCQSLLAQGGDYVDNSPEAVTVLGSDRIDRNRYAFVVSRKGACGEVYYNADDNAWMVVERFAEADNYSGIDVESQPQRILTFAHDRHGFVELNRSGDVGEALEVGHWTNRLADSVAVDKETYELALRAYSGEKVTRREEARLLRKLNEANERSVAEAIDIPAPPPFTLRAVSRQSLVEESQTRAAERKPPKLTRTQRVAALAGAVAFVGLSAAGGIVYNGGFGEKETGYTVTTHDQMLADQMNQTAATIVSTLAADMQALPESSKYFGRDHTTAWVSVRPEGQAAPYLHLFIDFTPSLQELTVLAQSSANPEGNDPGNVAISAKLELSDDDPLIKEFTDDELDQETLLEALQHPAAEGSVVSYRDAVHGGSVIAHGDTVMSNAPGASRLIPATEQIESVNEVLQIVHETATSKR